MIKATLIHPDYTACPPQEGYPVKFFPPVNYYTKQSLPHTVFGVVVDACPESGRRDEVGFFFGKTVMLRKDFVDSSTAEFFAIREILLPNND